MCAILRVCRRADRQRELGMTLIELIVAMGVFSILLAIVGSAFIGATRSFSDQRGATDNARMASTSMNEVTRIIRAGTEIPKYGSATNDPVFAWAGAEALTVNSFIDAGTSSDPPPVRVQFSRNSNNELVEVRFDAYHVNTTYWAFKTTSDYSRIVARALTPAAASTPLFAYFTAAGTQLTPPTGGTLTPAQIQNIASVQVTMRVQTDGSGRVEPVEIQNMVGIPNLGVARVEVH